ncbi:MAG: PhzF family phenazine biosynthesis protein [Pirellulales bacterium]|jgi:PhzF family phenazine biosynthesis protein
MKIKRYQIDAFTNVQFTGNPAAVCVLEKPLSDCLMQSIATENNLSETAFVWGSGCEYEICWFTPVCEVELCGHATLAAAHALMAGEGVVGETIRFASRHRGALMVTRKGAFYELDFPRASFKRQASDDSLARCVSESAVEFWSTGQDALLVFADSNLIGALSVDFPQLRELKYRALITTSVGNDCDFVSRFFAPSLGINEDAVTGSAHTVLTPFWAERLGKQKLVARQLSQRGGDLRCEVVEDRVLIGGEAVTYSVGNIIID